MASASTIQPPVMRAAATKAVISVVPYTASMVAPP
jgi:hypothetical protein